MAYIQFANVDETSFAVRLNGLDTNYNQTIRTVTFWCYEYYSDDYIGRESFTIDNGISRTKWVYFEDLEPDTRYAIEVRVSNIGGTGSLWFYDDVWTDEEVVDLVPPSFSIYDYGEDYITVQFGKVAGADLYGLYIDRNWVGDFEPYFAYATGLTAGTRYRVQMDSYNSTTDEDSGLSTSKYVTTLYPYPTGQNVSSITATSARLTWNSVTNATNYYIYLNGSYIGSTTSRSYDFSNLSPNTTYTCYVTAYNGTAESNSGFAPLTQFTTANLTPLSSPTAPTLYLGSENYRYEGGFRVQWGSVTGAYNYTLKVRRGYDNSTTNYTTSSTNRTVTGLQYGVTYYVSVKANHPTNSALDSSYSTENPLTTRPKQPTLSYETTSTSITVRVTGLESNFDSARVNLYTSSGSYMRYGSVTGNNQTVTFTGLSPNTNYQIDGKTYYGTIESFYTPRISITTNARPLNWSWEYTIASGQPFYAQSGNTIFIMRASHWNAFTSRINEFRRYKGLSDYSFTTAVTSHTESQIRACVNQAITAINAMGFSQPSVYSGDSVAASTFTTMRNNLNSIT